MRLTQRQLVIEYVKENGSIIPAKMGGKPYKDKFFGSELPRRCRELREAGILKSEQYGKFERFYLPEVNYQEKSMGDGYQKFQDMGKRLKGQLPEETLKDKYNKALTWYETNYDLMTKDAKKNAEIRLNAMLHDLELQNSILELQNSIQEQLLEDK